jgi:putative tricarboxylic transport membrane protein
VLDALLSGLTLVLQWQALIFLLIGVLIGIWMGAVPGLGGAVGLVLLLPFTFAMDPVPAFALLLGSWAATSTSGAISSVLLGIPGTAAAQATILDGYPLAKRGQAARAMGAAFTASAIGGVFGAIMLAISLPLILPVIRSFQAPETFMLGMLGLTMVAALSGRSISKGLVAAALGTMLALVGMPAAQAVPRFTFGTLYLLDELPVIPVLLGLFGIPEVMELAIKRVSISRVSDKQAEGGGLMDGAKDALREWGLVLRCSAIGTYIGMIPGLGASIVGWVTYGHAMQSSKDSSKFGQGDIRGVLAPEAANNALRGGALIPTLSMGIPGSVGTAVLLGALIMLGLRPGTSMLTDNLDVTISMVWQIALASVLATLLLFATAKHLTRIAFIPCDLLVPGVLLFIFMGAWLGSASIGDWISCTLFGLIGFVMKRGGWSRPPVILALVLGGMLESSFQISMRIHQGAGWLSRPIVIVIILIIIASIVMGWRRLNSQQRPDSSEGGEDSKPNPTVSLPFALGLLVLFISAGLESLDWPRSVKQLPVLVASIGAALSCIVIIQDSRNLLSARTLVGNFKTVLSEGWRCGMMTGATKFLVYLVGLILLTLLLGMKLALPLTMIAYLRFWGSLSWRFAVGYGLVGWLIIVGFYDRILGLTFYPSWLSQHVQTITSNDWLRSMFI